MSVTLEDTDTLMPRLTETLQGHHRHRYLIRLSKYDSNSGKQPHSTGTGGAHLRCEHSSMDGAEREERGKVTQGRRHQQN